MSLLAKIKYIYPELPDDAFKPDGIIALADHGNGPVIQRWDYSKPQPTIAQLNAITPAQVNITLASMRQQEEDKEHRLNIGLVAGYQNYLVNNPGTTFRQYRIQLKQFMQSLT